MWDFLLFGLNEADQWWDIKLTIASVVFSAFVGIPLSIVAYFFKKNDKSLEDIKDTLAEHTSYHAASNERVLNQKDFNERIAEEQKEQWNRINEAQSKLQEHGEKIVSHEATLRALRGAH